MGVPIYVTKPFLPPREIFDRYLDQIWNSHTLTNFGPLHQELEGRLKEYLNVPCVKLVSNGHMALELTLRAMNLSGEVITTPFTFASTTHAIVRNGLKPVFCDINTEDYTIDTSRIEDLITDNTTAIVPVHVYGNPCDVVEIERIANKNHLKVIYDAAHAFGVEVSGKGIGDFGDSSIYSFHATKVFHTFEGGAVVIRSEQQGYILHQLRNFGITGEDRVECVAPNAKMNEVEAAMGLCNLKYVEGNIAQRKEIAERYCDLLSGINGVKLPYYRSEVKYNYAYFPVLFEKKVCGCSRDEVCAALNQQSIFPRKYFYPLTSQFQCYAGQFNVEDTPNARKISEDILTLPIYPGLSSNDVDRICSVIIECCRKKL
ncbi:MAG: DegT/DnrJ/EryC1/StrS family aminotransferase [Clostridiales bacterium]|nr:DegT/DnrJ/EryC1/StrS family aminotransferase [Clostridiales bacterium]